MHDAVLSASLGLVSLDVAASLVSAQTKTASSCIRTQHIKIKTFENLYECANLFMLCIRCDVTWKQDCEHIK